MGHLKCNTTLAGTGILGEKTREQIFSIHLQVFERRTVETQQRVKDSITYELQRSFQGLEERGQRVGWECFDDLEHKANEVVSFKKWCWVQDATGGILDVQTGEAVGSPKVTSDTGQNRVFDEPSRKINVQLDKAVVYRSTIPVCRDLLMTFPVDELPVLFIDSVETGKYVLCCELINTNLKTRILQGIEAYLSDLP
jgi:hypothetical protein